MCCVQPLPGLFDAPTCTQPPFLRTELVICVLVESVIRHASVAGLVYQRLSALTITKSAPTFPLSIVDTPLLTGKVGGEDLSVRIFSTKVPSGRYIFKGIILMSGSKGAQSYGPIFTGSKSSSNPQGSVDPPSQSYSGSIKG